MKKRYEITANIGKKQIEEFVDDFFEFLLSKNDNPNNIEPDVINIVFKSDINTETGEIIENEIKGYIDPLYLSYVFLFLQETSKSKVNFIFEYTDEDEWKKLNNRFFSLKTQLEQFTYIISNSIERITLLKHSKQYPIPSNTNYLSQKEIPSHSEKFIPPIFIKKNDIESAKLFFKPKNELGNTEIEKRLSNLQKKYEEKIVENVKIKAFEESERNLDNTISKIKTQILLDGSNFIETTILLLAINSETFLSMKGLTKEKRIIIKEQNLNKILYYTKYVREVSKGLQELAINIAQHSNSNGIITARIFNKKKIIQLKGKESIEAKFTEETDIENFLDINIIDIGVTSVKDKYINNLNDNADEIKLIEISTKEIEDDIKLIQNYSHKDFYIINENFFKLHHQQNKLISRYGLHHFTSIVRDELNGFIKTSSQDEQAILGIENDENTVTFFPKTGTMYNCIIPLKPIIKNSFDDNDNKKDRDLMNINSLDTFNNLQYYKITTNYKLKFNDIERINYLYKYPLDKHLGILDVKKKEFSKSKYEYLAYVYYDIYQTNNIPTNGILLLDAEKINIDDYSDCSRLLSALNSKYKDIIIYNSKLSYLTEIKKVRKDYEEMFHKIISKTENDNEKRKKIGNLAFDYKFWSENARVLFYSKKKSEKDDRYFRYGANLLIGTSYKQFNFINYSIWRYRYSFSTKDDVFPEYKDENKEHFDTKPPIEIFGNKIFLNNKLNYFELLISITDNINNQNITLFEKSLQYSLNKEFAINKKSNNSGYKILNTHFRLGSKIHISDFYYAKRLFQNSFFSLPLAFLLANYISNNDIIGEKEKVSIVGYETYSNLISSYIRVLLKEKYPEKSFNNIVITKEGKLSREYEKLNDYVITIVPIASTFSTSIKIKKDLDNIVNIFNQKHINNAKRVFNKIEHKLPKFDNKLKDKINDLDFYIILNNSDLIEQLIEQLLNIKQQTNTNKENLNGKIDNIVNSLRNIRDKHSEIISYLNIVLVGHKENDSYFDSIKNSNEKIIEYAKKSKDGKGIFEKFNWKYYDYANKIIKIEPFTQTGDIEQKYFIPLYSHWHKAEDCKLCFPDSEPLLNEKCVIETGQASITPKIVFDYPKTFDEKCNDNYKYLNFEDSLLVGNLLRNKSKYWFFIKTGSVIKKNKYIVEEWLKGLKRNVFKETNERIVLITPSYLAKSNFINLVNTHIFDDTANSILISLDDEFIENSEALYSDALHNARIIIYVDDIMHTSNSFFKANNIVKYIRNSSIDYCITLINRIPYDIENNIKSTLISQKILYYQKINIPVINAQENKFPADIKRKKYEFLANISSLDAVRTRFIQKKEKLNPININLLSDYDSLVRESIDDGITYKNKMLFQLNVLNALYKLFNFKSNGADEKKGKYLKNDLIKNIFNSKDTSKSLNTLIKYLNNELIKHNDNTYSKYKDEIHNIIFKSITNSPLGRHKNIRETNYKWILSKLNELIKEINSFKLDNISDDDLIKIFYRNNEFSYSKIETLKFLLKRSVYLQSNYIISKDFFEIIKKILLLIDEYNNRENISKKEEIKTEELDFYASEKNMRITEITSKEFIYYIISMVQDLLYGHEVKAIKLEDYLNNSIEQIDNYKDNTSNGDFAHFIRLLKLENTELFYKLYNYYITDKQKYIEEKKIEDYETDPKYTILYDLFQSKSIDIKKNIINEFINLCEKLDTPDSSNSNTVEFIGSILKGIEKILGNENILASYLTVNHNNEKSDELKSGNLTIFKGSKYEPNNKEINFLHNMSNSLTFKMFEGVKTIEKKKSYEISNFEVYKKNNDDRYYYRKNLNLKEIINFTEISSIDNNKINPFSILLIRISDFYKEKNNNHKTELYPQAVITVISKNGKRFNEERIRLVLLLRHFISKYLKSGIPYKVFMDLKKYDEREKYIRATRHQFTNIIAEIKNRLSNNENSINKSDYKIISILLNALNSQKFSAQQMREPENKSLLEINKLIKLVLEAKIPSIGKIIDNHRFDIDASIIKNSYKLPKIFIHSILIQILFNIKHYSKEISNVNIRIFEDDNFIIFEFENQIDINEIANRLNSIEMGGLKPEGVFLIKRQVGFLKDIIYYYPTEIDYNNLKDGDIYKSIFKIRKNNEL